MIGAKAAKKTTDTFGGITIVRTRIQDTIELLKDNVHKIDGKKAVLGFDGFIDCVVRVIKNKKDDDITFFQDMAEFGSYIISKRGRSCSLELREQVVKIGGNMPIMASALGRLGIKVNCIGALGYPVIRSEFEGMITDNCILHSVAEPGLTTAMEFNDGKVMLAHMKMVDEITWDSIKTIVGIENLIHFFNKSDIAGLVNWSEVENSSDIWEGIINDVLPGHLPNKNQLVFFDLSDCSKKHVEDIQHALNLIETFSRHFKVILGMNENESRLIHNAIFKGGEDHNDLAHIGESIFNRLDIDMLVIHPRNYSMAWDTNGSYTIENMYIEVPQISTGGGDNFNAGFCLAQLLGADITTSLLIANAASGFYVKNGFSADIQQLQKFMDEWQKMIA